MDEVDQLDSKDQQVLYTMFEWPHLPSSRLILIGSYEYVVTEVLSPLSQVSVNASCQTVRYLARFNIQFPGIANALDLTDRILPRLQGNSKCKPKLMNFPPYSKDQIATILRDRLAQVCTMFLEFTCIFDYCCYIFAVKFQT